MLHQRSTVSVAIVHAMQGVRGDGDSGDVAESPPRRLPVCAGERARARSVPLHLGKSSPCRSAEPCVWTAYATWDQTPRSLRAAYTAVKLPISGDFLGGF